MKLFDKTRHLSIRGYVAYQEKITENHLLPLFRRLEVPLDRPILDVGCGKGGCVLALAEQVSVPLHGIDILPDDIDAARAAAADAGASATFDVVDIIEDPLPSGRYGLLLLRDVVEHLPDLETALTRLRPMLDEGGLMYVTFPPWRGPYAGHQHNARSVARFLPYLHSIAPKLFMNLLQSCEPTRTDWLIDTAQICKNRLTRRKFERTARAAGWRIHYRQTYFLRPAFMRMGLPTVPNGFIGRLPLVGEMLSTACEYLLAPR